MSDRLGMLIEQIIGTNPKEDFALFFCGDEWRAEWKNPCSMVLLGESEGEFQSEWFATPEQAAHDLLMAIRMDYEPNPPAHPTAATGP